MHNGRMYFFHLSDRSLFLCLWLYLERFLFEPVEHSLLGRRRLGRSLLRLNELLRGLLGLLEVFLKTNETRGHVTPQQSHVGRDIYGVFSWEQRVHGMNKLYHGSILEMGAILLYVT